ncbi:hypothetical protein GH714_039964 [Hevea brasiliensis]|uniref:Uncharacterized protein n=1 Tax=Hevea brasiliensis TaxID=3981 RepID=A0A6A6M8N6_HEVBR|nr:hypothetical protein GH714_039964 [Hevea brasiliensis]
MRVLEVNLLGGALGAKHAARVMIPEKKGFILFTASVASEMCSASYPYKASKNAIVGLTKNLAVELGQYGIRVNCISPGAVPTPLTKATLRLDEKQVQDYSCAISNLKGATLDANDVAEAALYLASDDSKFVSGLNLWVEGAEKIRSQTGQPVSYESDVESAVNTTVSMHGKLDIMFNNAGISGKPDLRISSIEREDFQRVLEVNVLAHPYKASEHAIVGLTKNLAVELGQHGIRVNCISSGAVPTPLTTTTLGLDEKRVQD